MRQLNYGESILVIREKENGERGLLNVVDWTEHGNQELALAHARRLASAWRSTYFNSGEKIFTAVSEKTYGGPSKCSSVNNDDGLVEVIPV